MQRFHLNTSSSLFVAVIVLGGGFALYTPQVSAGTYRVVLDECKKQTKLSESFCKTIVKNNLNVKSCMDRAGLSEKECEKRIEEIKNDPEFTGGSVSSSTTPAPQTITPSSSRSLSLPQTSVQNKDLIGRIRSKKENDLIELGKRTESILALLRAQGVDTTAIEANFPELEKKMTTLLGSYDTFRAAYAGTTKDVGLVRNTVRDDARGVVLRALNDLVDFYRTKILVPIRVARDQIK